MEGNDGRHAKPGPDRRGIVMSMGDAIWGTRTNRARHLDARGMTSPRGSAERVIYLLRLVIEGSEQFTLGELAERSGLPLSSVHRLLRPLLTEGIVERGDGQTYRTGRELTRLASQLMAQFDPVRSARPLLAGLVRKWSETAVLCLYAPVRRRAVVAAVANAACDHCPALEEGIEIELPWGSLGQAILASLPPGESEAIFRSITRSPIAGRPPAKRAQFLEQMRRIREEGVARNLDEELGLAGVAAPVFDGAGRLIGSLGVVMPLPRFHAARDADLVRDVVRAANSFAGRAADSTGRAHSFHIPELRPDVH